MIIPYLRQDLEIFRADISLSQDNKKVYVPDMKAGTLTILDLN